MRSDTVLLPKPTIDGDLGLPCGVEPFSGERFFSHCPVKPLIILCVGETVSHTVF